MSVINQMSKKWKSRTMNWKKVKEWLEGVSYLVLIVVLSFFFVSCAAYPELKLPMDSEIQVLDEAPQEFKVSVKASPEPHTFYVKITDPSFLSRKTSEWKLVRRNLRDFNSEILLTHKSQHGLKIANEEAAFYDFDIQENDKIQYELWVDQKLAHQSYAHIPYDLTIRGRQIVEQNMTRAPHRIFFQEGASLVFLEGKFHWKVHRIFGARGAKILSFDSSSDAVAEKDGKNSAMLRLEAERLTGTISVSWRGQNGGPGPKGSSAKLRGKKGAKGRDGKWTRSRTVLGEYEPAVCHRNPQNGQAGGAGARGGVGGDGGKGGNTRSLFFSIAKVDRNARVDWKVSPGSGGNGGRGGVGGPGGYGGKPGADGKICKKAQPGPNGPHGKSGSAGKPGEDGKLQGHHCLAVGKRFIRGSCTENML